MQSYREVECNLCENWLKEVNFESHLFDHHESEDCSDAMGEAREVLAGFHLDVGVGADVDVGKNIGKELVIECIEKAISQVQKKLNNWFDDSFDENNVMEVEDEWFESQMAGEDENDAGGEDDKEEEEPLKSKEVAIEEEERRKLMKNDGIEVMEQIVGGAGGSSGVMEKVNSTAAAGTIDKYLDGRSSFIRGLVVAKSGPKMVKSKFTGQYRGHHTNLTIKDENGESANVTIWSELQLEVNILEKEFHSGDVVQIRCAAVVDKVDAKHGHLDPNVTTEKRLRYVNGKTSLKKVDRASFKGYKTEVVKPYLENGVPVTFDKVVKKEVGLGMLVSFFGFVKEVTHELKVAPGQTMTSVLVTDGANDMKMMLWEEDQKRSAKKLDLGQQIHCSGVKVQIDTYKKICCFTGTSKTVLTSMVAK